MMIYKILYFQFLFDYIMYITYLYLKVWKDVLSNLEDF